MQRIFDPVPLMGVAFGVALVLAVAVLAALGTDAKSIGVGLRLTARWSFLLFWIAYTAGPMAVLFGPALAPLARGGRGFGLAFAAAHLIHVGLVIWLYRISDRAPLSATLFTFFAVGIIWTYLLAILSFGGLSAALGPRGWRAIRLLGLNYILLAFGFDFVPPVIHLGTGHEAFWRMVTYAPFAAMTIAAPLLRFAAAAHRWRASWNLAA